MSATFDPIDDSFSVGERRLLTLPEHAYAIVSSDELVTNGKLDIYPEILNKGYLNIGWSNRELIIRAGGYVGLIPVNDRIAIEVRPRVPVNNLDRILRITEQVPVSLGNYARFYETSQFSNPSLLDMFARALITGTSYISTYGLHHEYQLREEDTSFPRGRINVGRTLAKHRTRGINHRVAASWYQHSIDTSPNRCLKYALWTLSQRYRALQPRTGIRQIVRLLNSRFHLFDDVELDHSRNFLNDRRVLDPANMPAGRFYYGDALRVAVAVIRDRGLTFDGQRAELALSSLLFSFQDLFEDYVRKVAAGSHLFGSDSDLAILDGNKAPPNGGAKALFDSEPSTAATPDFLIRDQRENTYPMVFEVKYKVVTGVPAREDVNQALTYALSYRSPIAIIIHPAIELGPNGLHFVGRIADIELFQYGFNLASDDLQAEEKAFIGQILQLMQQKTTDVDLKQGTQ